MKTKELNEETEIVQNVSPALEEVDGRIEFEIKKFNLADSRINELRKIYSGLTISGMEDKDGYNNVKEAIKVVRTLRTSVESKRKELKSFYLETGRGIDAEAKRLTALLEEIENPLKEAKEEIDEQFEAIKREEEEREQKRIDERVEVLLEAGLVFTGHFYSIGENISVDIVTISELSDEDFERLKNRVKEEKSRIEAVEAVAKLHEERKERILLFWSFMSDDERQKNFGEMSEEDFGALYSSLESKKKEFDAEAERQKMEAEKAKKEAEELERSKKEFYFKSRSFSYKTKGFEVLEDGVIRKAFGVIVFVSRIELENDSDEMFEEKFDKNIKRIEEAFKKEEEAKIKALKEAEEARIKALKEADEARNKALIERRFKLINQIDGVKIDVTEEEILRMEEDVFFALLDSYSEESERRIEAERLAKLPDVNKLEEYIEKLSEIKLPEVNDESVQLFANMMSEGLSDYFEWCKVELNEFK